ncbi:MAG: hypothetical protein HYU33_06285 [Candidatus Omnitrophica bacterium]|nr:hypothetical protein [Candidatus Omnitrophota bacterium]
MTNLFLDRRWILGWGTAVLLFVAIKPGQDSYAQEQSMNNPLGTYATYTAEEPELHVDFRYPSEWKLTKERGRIESYRQIRIQGPRNAEDTYTCYLSVLSAPNRDNGGTDEDVASRVSRFTKHLYKDPHVLSENVTPIAGVQATDLVVTFTIPPLHQPGLKALAIPVKTRSCFFQKGPYLYELTLSADAREFDRYAAAFEELLQSWKFR